MWTPLSRSAIKLGVADLSIKCRRGGCGTIIEEFWQFCPSCGTQVSFEDREAVAGRRKRKARLA
jgi:rRNA maturation endonuclease Nob1